MLLVSDTNIIIDLETGGLVDELLALEDDVGVPNVLFHDELSAQHDYLEQAGLRVLALDGETMMRAFQLAGRYQKPSRNDLMALALAEQERGVLLTGDRDLRDVAETEQVPVHGTIWIIGQMIDAALHRHLANSHSTLSRKPDPPTLPGGRAATPHGSTPVAKARHGGYSPDRGEWPIT